MTPKEQIFRDRINKYIQGLELKETLNEEPLLKEELKLIIADLKLIYKASEPAENLETRKANLTIPVVIERFKAVEEAVKLVYSRDIGKLSLLNRLEELGKELNIETSL